MTPRASFERPGDRPSRQEGSRPVSWQAGVQVPAPLRLHEAIVRAEWVDYNGHLTEWAYLLMVGDDSDAFFRFLGIDDDYRASGRSIYTVETHMHHLREVTLGERLRLSLHVLDVDDKRLHIVHEMHCGSGALVATAEQMLLHVNTRAGKVDPFPPEIGERLRQIRAAHAALPVPGYIGHVMGIPGEPAPAGG